MKTMRLLWSSIYLGCVVWLLVDSLAFAQTKVSIDEETRLKERSTHQKPDTLQSEMPKSLTFTASTDQRFTFFNDTRTEDNRRTPVSVYGIRAGFLFPPSHRRANLKGGRMASFKAGAGFYFVNQSLNQPGLLPNSSESVTRRLRMATVYYERYLFRQKAFEISMPLELGYGHSRYERNDDASEKHELARGVFIPLGVGASGAYHFPTVRWLPPLHWFGINMLVGYRFVLKKDIPESQINYTGLYLSVGPSFFLENLTADIKRWSQKRKRAK